MRCGAAVLALGALLVLAGCGSNIKTNQVADAPPVSSDREVVFTEDDPGCRQQKVGDIRVKASDWPEVRTQVETEVRAMGGDAVVRWHEREVVEDSGGNSTMPGASASRPHRTKYYFGIVVRREEGCSVSS